MRENRNGTYVTLSYGRPCVSHVDPIEKKPFFHVYPGKTAFSIATVGCNFTCKFCQNWDISQASPQDVRAPYRPPEEIVRMAAESKARAIAYTYSEPTIFTEYVLDCARAGREKGLASVVVSNGFIAAKPLEELCGAIAAIKIDLKAFTDTFYQDVCGGRLKPVQDTLKRLSVSKVWFEIVVLIIPTLNDGMDDIKRMAGWIAKELGPNVPVHFTRFHAAYKLQNLPDTPPRTLVRAREVARQEGCRFVYTGNMPGAESESTFCPQCQTALIRRDGHAVLSNDIVKGRCPKCQEVIPGVWD